MDYYSILEISRNATYAEIKKAYLRAALKHHPDRGGSTIKMQQINLAYETLRDEDRRVAYDFSQTAQSEDTQWQDSSHYHSAKQEAQQYPDDLEELLSMVTAIPALFKSIFKYFEKTAGEMYEEYCEFEQELIAARLLTTNNVFIFFQSDEDFHAWNQVVEFGNNRTWRTSGGRFLWFIIKLNGYMDLFSAYSERITLWLWPGWLLGKFSGMKVIGIALFCMFGFPMILVLYVVLAVLFGK